MKFALRFSGELIVQFDHNETESQIEFLMSIEPKTEEESEIVSNLLLKIIENGKHSLSS